MKKDGPRRARAKERLRTCSYCKGTGRDLARSLWGEFICPVCGGTGKSKKALETESAISK